MGWKGLFLVGVIVSYVEAKKRVEDAFLSEAIAGATNGCMGSSFFLGPDSNSKDLRSVFGR
jgi:hypothetical protein